MLALRKCPALSGFKSRPAGTSEPVGSTHSTSRFVRANPRATVHSGTGACRNLDQVQTSL